MQITIFKQLPLNFEGLAQVLFCFWVLFTVLHRVFASPYPKAIYTKMVHNGIGNGSWAGGNCHVMGYQACSG